MQPIVNSIKIATSEIPSYSGICGMLYAFLRMQFWKTFSQKLRKLMTSMKDAFQSAKQHLSEKHEKEDERHVPKKEEHDKPVKEEAPKAEPTSEVIPPADPNEPLDPNKQKVWPHPPNPGPLDPAPGQGRPS